MYIISQNFINEAKKIIKNTFLTQYHLSFHFDLDLIVSGFNTYNYATNMLKLKLGLKELMRSTIEKSIKKIDEAFACSYERKQHYYLSGKRDRTIVTIFGELNFERYYYVTKEKTDGFYLIDYLFNFEKYTTYDATIRALLIDQSVSTNPNKVSDNSLLCLGDYFNYMDKNVAKNISRQTIYNWINKWDIPKVNYKTKPSTKTLYVMADEKWIHEQIRLSLLTEEERNKRHYIMSKCFVAFTDVCEKSGRRSLENRHIFMTSNKDAWKEFVDEIYNIYNFEEIENIYFMSDAGSWILAGTSELKLFTNNKVTVNTCEFHAIEYIHRLTRSKEKREKIKDVIFNQNNKEEFITLADEIIEKTSRKGYKTKLKNYLLNHWETIRNMKEREVGSSMESHISHYVANNFGSRPKGFSRKRIEKRLKLEALKANGINIMSLYLKSLVSSNYNVENEEKISFSIFEKDTSVLPTISSSNPLSILLNNIAYN